MAKAASTILGRSDKALAPGVDDDFAVFLGERADIRVLKNIEHRFGRAAEPDAERRLDEGPVDQNGMGQHGVEQGVIGEGRVIEAQFGIGRILLPDRLAHGKAGIGDQLLEASARWRVGAIVDDLRLDAGLADHRQGIARGAAVGIVIDDDGHWAGFSFWFLAALSSKAVRVRLARATSESMTGTSTSTPTTVASAAGEDSP